MSDARLAGLYLVTPLSSRHYAATNEVRRDDATVTTRLTRTVVMIGMMGAGKTAVGTALARQLSVPFIDSDHEIERAANRSIAEIFMRDGEAFFRARESQVLARLLDGPAAILSTGGGAWLNEDNRKLISRKGISVWLSAELDLLWARVRHKNTRPLLCTEDPKATLAKLLRARMPLYALADLTIVAEPQLSVEQMASKVRGALESYGVLEGV